MRAFLDLDVTEAPPNHSTLSRTRRLIDVETHVAVFTWVLERLAGAGLVQGKTVGVDATTLEANAAMRSIERRDTGESYEAFVRQLAKASGIETPPRAELARFDRSRKDRKTSNKEWQSPQDTDAKIAKMKDGRTHLAHKAEHGIDLETGAILSVTVQEASEGDSATLPATLTMAAEQVEAVQPAGAEVEEVVADKGYRSDAMAAWLFVARLAVYDSYVSEPERGRRCWHRLGHRTWRCGASACWERKAARCRSESVVSRGDRGRRVLRTPQLPQLRAAKRMIAQHQYETAGLRLVWPPRPRDCAQAGAHRGGRVASRPRQQKRRLTAAGTPRSLQGRALSAICGLIGRLTALWGRLTACPRLPIDDLPTWSAESLGIAKKPEQARAQRSPAWVGYKLHLDVADGQIPISCLLTSASLHDSQAAIPLATLSAERTTNLYDLMDAAYDAKPIRQHSRSLGHVPLIDTNPRRDKTLAEELRTEARRLQRIGFQLPEQVRYNERTAGERVNGRLKDEFGGRHVRVRGASKVMCHCMFGVLALTADQLVRLVT